MYAFAKREIAEKLKLIALSHTVRSSVLETGHEFPGTQGLWVVPYTKIEAAQKIKGRRGFRIRPGEGLGIIYYRENKDNESYASFLSNYEPGLMDSHIDPVHKERSIIKVYNACEVEINSDIHLNPIETGSGATTFPDPNDFLKGPICFCVQDAFGDYWVVKICDYADMSSSSSSSSHSSSSGSSSSSSGSDSSSSSHSSSSESKSESSEESSAGECDYTGEVIVGDGNIHREGDLIVENQTKLTFRNGLLCSVTPYGQQSVYLCCDDPDTPSSESSLSSTGCCDTDVCGWIATTNADDDDCDCSLLRNGFLHATPAPPAIPGPCNKRWQRIWTEGGANCHYEGYIDLIKGSPASSSSITYSIYSDNNHVVTYSLVDDYHNLCDQELTLHRTSLSNTAFCQNWPETMTLSPVTDVETCDQANCNCGDVPGISGQLIEDLEVFLFWSFGVTCFDEARLEYSLGETDSWNTLETWSPVTFPSNYTTSGFNWGGETYAYFRLVFTCGVVEVPGPTVVVNNGS